MSHTRATALLCACALVVNVAANPALKPPRRERKESKMVQDEGPRVVRKLPTPYFYPFNLWPMPKLIIVDSELARDGHTDKRIQERLRHYKR